MVVSSLRTEPAQTSNIERWVVERLEIHTLALAATLLRRCVLDQASLLEHWTNLRLAAEPAIVHGIQVLRVAA